jgi:hypothetical protein
MGLMGAIWGLAGVTALLGYAVFRLSHVALDGLSLDLGWHHWALLVVNIAFMAYAEGVCGFQKRYSPRVVARAKHLLHSPRIVHVLLAPLFCMGYFHTTRRRLVSAYVLTVVIALFVVGSRQLDQPWRGILDAGVVVGLMWGITSIVVFAAHAFFGSRFDHSPELPPVS